MKSNRKIRSFIILFSLPFILLILTTLDCHSASTVPIPTKKIVNIPPDPVIDDGEPGEDPNFDWEFGNTYLQGDNKVSNNSLKAGQNGIPTRKMREKIIVRYILSVYFSLLR